MRFGLRELIMLFVVFAVPLASYFLVFKPQNAKINEAQGEIALKTETLRKLQAETARADDLVRVNAELEQGILDIEARLPTNKEVDEIVRQVSDLAVEAGLEPPALKSEKPVKAALYMEQPLNLRTKGDFMGWYTFLIALERMPRITRITDAKILGDGVERGKLEVEFTLSIYFQHERSGVVQ